VNLRPLVFAIAGTLLQAAAPLLAADLSRPPQLREGSITEDDYPPLALRAEMQGETRTLITIGADGRISNCQILKSSGSALLDTHSCALVSARFVFEPALDAKGHPVETQAVQPVAWVIPESEPLSSPAAEQIAPPASPF
jgi:TonB family protein